MDPMTAKSPLAAAHRIPLADEFRDLANATIEKNADDVTADEKIWAEDAFIAFLAQGRPRAIAGGAVAYVDMPESDALKSPVTEMGADNLVMLRGGAAALKKALEHSGFQVAIASRFNGHPRGEFCLEVRW
jgi:hypothetical protein